MKNALRISLLLIALLFLLAWRFAPARQASDEPEPSGEVRRPDAAVPDHTRTLRVLHGGAVEEMTMDEYLLGVLRAEMPASFELEALKAQAVAARTYTLHKMAQGAIARHPDADACDDITCCKAYETAEDAAAGWGAGALYYEEKLARAVAETDGEVIVYNGEPVLAVFFSSAAGHTQGAGEVWQTDLPYLQSVDSPEDDSLVPNYYSVVTFTTQEFRDRFLAVYPAAKLNGDAGSFLTDITRNDAGFVSTLRVGGVTVRGNELRTILGLRSPSFTVEVSGDTLTWIDCVHLFYNLMRTNKKEFEGQEETTSTVYASVLDFSLTSDGEINPLEALESKLKGPYAVKDRSLGTILPFSASSASYYLDGEGTTRDEVEDGAIVIYYNTTTKAVYGYSEDGNGGRGAYEGELEAVYYRSSDVMIPTSIVVSGREFALESSDMQFAFSVYGNMEIGDDIIIVWESSGSSSGEDADDTDGTVIDYID